jgi:hypothetical protein
MRTERLTGRFDGTSDGTAWVNAAGTGDRSSGTYRVRPLVEVLRPLYPSEQFLARMRQPGAGQPGTELFQLVWWKAGAQSSRNTLG